MFAYGHEEAAYVDVPLASTVKPKTKTIGKGKGKGKDKSKAVEDNASIPESSFICELRFVQQPPKYKEITRWIVQAPRDHQPGPFEAPRFLFVPTQLIDVHTPFVIVRARVAITSHTYGELCDYQSEFTTPVPDRFVPPLVLKSKRYFPKGGKPATGYVDGPSMAVKSIRTRAKKVATGMQMMNKSKRKEIMMAGRSFDMPLRTLYGTMGLANAPRTTGIRTRPTNIAPRWWIKEILGVFPRPSPIIANRLPIFCREWHPAIKTPCVNILGSLNVEPSEPLPANIMVLLDRLRINTTDKRHGKMLAVVREIENFLRLPMSGAAIVNLCAYYPYKALVGLSEAKITALANAFRVHAERTLFSAPVYFDLPANVAFREYEKQALGLVPSFRLDNRLSVTADQVELYRRCLYSAWYRGDVATTLPETLETEDEREARRAKEDKAREAARKRKARQRRREEGIGSDEEDFDLMIDDEDEDGDDEGFDLENPGPKRKKPAKRKRRDKFVIALQTATQELVESGRIIRCEAPEDTSDDKKVAISEYLAEEMQLATYLSTTRASVRVVENLRNASGYARYLGHSEEGGLLGEGVVFAFAPTEVEADRFARLSAVTTRCYAQLTSESDEKDGSVEIDTLIIVCAEQMGNACLFRILRRFTIRRHLILIGNPSAWRDPRYLGAGQPFRTLYDTAYSYKAERLSICKISEDDLGEVEAEEASGSPSLLTEACQLLTWRDEIEAKYLIVTGKRAKKALQTLASDADLWPNVQVFQSGFVHHDRVRELCPSPCAAFDAKSGMIRVGQRLYLRDTGERLVVAACGVGSTAATMSYWDTNPSSSLDSVSARRLNAIVETTLPLAKEHRKREYCGCTTSRYAKRFFPHRHHVTDGSCINIRQYSGPSVEMAFLLAGKGTCRKDLITLASLTSKQCYIIPMDDQINIYSVITTSGRDGWEPTTMLKALLVGEEKEEAPVDSDDE